MKSLCAVMLIAVLSGCATVGGNECSWARPIWPGWGEKLSQSLTDKLAAHNDAWDAACNAE